jgi:NADPH-dependent F420 reductase
MNLTKPTLAILGGSGDLGGGLAFRWARAGYSIIIGSRSADKASEAAAKLAGRGVGGSARGLDNEAAAAAGDIVVLTVPFAQPEAPTLEARAARQLWRARSSIDVTVPLVPPKVGTVQLPPGRLRRPWPPSSLLGDGRASVVSAFQNVAAAPPRRIRITASRVRRAGLRQ